ncbi:hypothetical protein JCM10213_009256 [Rhodosporidiobolus nylandii]
MVVLPLQTSATAPIASLLPTTPSRCQLVYASHGRWPLPPDAASDPISRTLRISVLDSSWNPPHAAHLSLARHGQTTCEALLLAFTVSHPDKGNFDKDVAALRLEMVRAVALDLQEKGANVAVALLDAATFVQKSRVLQGSMAELVKEHVGEKNARKTELAFEVGWDTLLRVFAPRYYQTGPSLTDSMNAFLRDDGSSLSCARRGEVTAEEESAFLRSPEVRPWADKVELYDLEDENVRDISSTEVRKAVKEGRWEDVRRDVPFERVIEVLQRERLYTV